MPQVSISLRPADVAYAEAMLAAIPNGARTAIRSAINDTLKSERAEMVGQVRGEMNALAKEVRARIDVTDRPRAYSLSGALSVSYGRLRLEDFRPKPKERRGAGVAGVVMKRKGPIRFRHGFEAPVGPGHQALLIRRGPKRVPTKGRYAGRTVTRGPRKGQPVLRQAVTDILAAPVVGVYEQFPQLLDVVVSDTGRKFHDRLLSKVEWMLARGNANFAK